MVKGIAPQRLAGNPISITGLRDLVGVNALASGQGLTFAASGLNIVYGDNGTGKSGLVRVLKSACRSRDDKTSILRDVNAADDIVASRRGAGRGLEHTAVLFCDVGGHGELNPCTE